MNEKTFEWQSWIEENRGKVSFIISLVIILLLDRLKIVTFDSVMPYLAGTGIWAALWNKKPFFQKKWILLSAPLSIIICIDLCIEGFLAVPSTPVAVLKFLVMYVIVLLIVGGFTFQIPSEKFSKAVYAIGCILFGFFSCAGNYIVFEKIALPDKPFVFFLLFLLSFLSWGMLFGSALNAFHFLAGNMDCQKSSPVRLNAFFVWGGDFFPV